MEEVLQKILEELKKISSQLEDIQGAGLYKSISDVCSSVSYVEDKLDDIKELLEKAE